MHFARHATPPRAGIFCMPAFRCWKRVQCACRWQAGVRHRMDGARAVSFPAPMGNRTVYRVVDIADHFIQPHYFRTQTVEFRIGSELRALNRLLSAVRRIRQVLGNSLPGKLELPSALKVESGALLTMGQRSRSQHRFSLVWSYNAHRGVALLLLKGSQRIIVINVPWCLSSSERVSPPTC